MSDISQLPPKFNRNIDMLLILIISQIHVLQANYLATVRKKVSDDITLGYMIGTGACVELLQKLINDSTGHIKLGEQTDKEH